MTTSEANKARNTSTFLAIFGAFFLLPGLGILLFKTLPLFGELLAGSSLSSTDKEALTAAGVIGTVFPLVGGGLVYWGLKKPVDNPDLYDSDTPWLARKNWSSPVIKDSFLLSGGWLWGVALIWNLISAPALLALQSELDKGNQAIWLVLLFPAAGLLLIGAAIRKTLDWRRFGAMTVTLDPHPGAIGGEVGGTIRLPTALPVGTPVTVSLDCVYHYSQGKSSSQRVVWQYGADFRPQQSRRSTTLNFLFELPADLPASELSGNSYHRWTLHVGADIDGIDLARQVEIPVFPTAAKAAATIRRNAVIVAAESSEQDTLISANMADFVDIVGQHARKGFVAGLIVGFVLMGFSAVFGYLIGYREAESIFLAFGILFAVIGLIIFITSIIGRLRSYWLRLTKTQLELERRGLFGSKHHKLDHDKIAALTTTRSGSMQVAGKHYELFTLSVQPKIGAPIHVGKKLSRRQAETLSATLADLMGIPAQKNSV